MKKLFVFTGGGLAPALNSTLYGVITAARERGWKVLGGLYGWASLLQNGRHIILDNLNIEPIRDSGGTLLRSSRTNPLASIDGPAQVKEKLRDLGVDAVLAIGGDDTLGAASELFQEGVPIVGIPKTIDNDLSHTYYTPGFPSAAHYLSSFVNEIREDAAYALSRIFVIESLGMKAGWLTAAACYGHADIIIPPEQPVSLRNMLETLKNRYHENGNYAVVIVGQEAHFDEPLERFRDQFIDEQYGHLRHSYICLSLREKIKKELGVDTKALYPGNWLETGKPTSVDRDMSIALGRRAVKLIADGKIGQMVTITRPDDKKIDLEIGEITLSAIVGKQNYRVLPPEFFNFKTFRPEQKFYDYMEPLLGKFQPKDDDYTKLTKMMMSHLG